MLLSPDFYQANRSAEAFDDFANDQPILADDQLVCVFVCSSLTRFIFFFKTENASVEFARMGFNEQDGAEFYPIDELQSKSSKRQFLGVDIDSIISSNDNFSMNTKLF